jgi:hypothetical protein
VENIVDIIKVRDFLKLLNHISRILWVGGAYTFVAHGGSLRPKESGNNCFEDLTFPIITKLYSIA